MSTRNSATEHPGFRSRRDRSQAPRHTFLFSYRSQLYLLLAPYLGGVLLLVLVPMVITVVLSFTSYDIFSPPEWFGLGNFQHFFIDQLFQRALFNSLWFATIAAPLRVVGALLLALALNHNGRAFEFARATIYLPTIVPDIAYALVWLLILNPGFGPVNLALNALGLPGIPWLLEPLTARVSIVVMWMFQLGEGFVLMLAVLQTISPDLFESAALDGANRFQRFYRIILPLMVPALLLLTFRDTALSFQGTFVPAIITTDTGPYYSTYFLPHYIYDESFGLFKYGYGSAVTTLVYFLTVFLIGLEYVALAPWGRPDEI